MNNCQVIRTGWKFLQYCLQEITDRLNQRTPIQGAGIQINEKPNGFVISLPQTPLGDDVIQQVGSGLTADEIALITFIKRKPTPKNVDPLAVPFYPWKPGASVGWLSINIMDATCVQYSIYVWASKPVVVPPPS